MNRSEQNWTGLVSKENCGVCGIPLIYQTKPILMSCAFCRQEHDTNIYCSNGHYVCDTCHQHDSLDILKQVLNSSNSIDPNEILETVMSHSSVPMHGPEHHIMVPVIIITAVKNAGYSIPDGAIDEAINRGTEIPGGWCGFYGACGAALGVGIAVSILNRATPLTGIPRSMAIEATSYSLSKMIDGYPRCCKRASRKALEAAREYLRDNMNITFDQSNAIECAYSSRNLECLKEICSYYSGN